MQAEGQAAWAPSHRYGLQLGLPGSVATASVQVPVAQVSALDSTQSASATYTEAKKHQHAYLTPTIAKEWRP